MAESAPIQTSRRTPVSARRLKLLSTQRQESEALRALRQRALALYNGGELPHRAAHLWRYSDPACFVPQAHPLPMGPVLPEEIKSPDRDGVAVLLQPGTHMRAQLSPALKDAGLRILRLGSCPPQLDLLGTAVPATHGIFEALNLATWTSGALIFVPKGMQLAQRIIIDVPTSLPTSTTRLMIVVEEGARATFVERHHGGGAGHLANHVTEIFVCANAQVDHLFEQHWSPGTRGLLCSRSQVERNARHRVFVDSQGGAESKLDLGICLEGPGAQSEIAGVVLAGERQRHDLHTAQIHEAGHSSSSIDIKTVVGGHAQCTYTGRIAIEPGAAGSEAFQENRNLLLSSRAQARSIPELEIRTDDVSCSHGATVAPIDETQLVYLQSRGLDRARAMQLIVGGFIESTLGKLNPELYELRRETYQRRAAELIGERP